MLLDLLPESLTYGAEPTNLPEEGGHASLMALEKLLNM